jgi:hypothetical protein
MKSCLAFLLCAAAVMLIAPSASAVWVTKDGRIDYTMHMVVDNAGNPTEDRTDGMPDFDQKQDAWVNAQQQWTWCGPVAVSNCLWWFDSKFETIKCKSLPAGTLVRPPSVSDHYSLVYAIPAAGTVWDDHDPQNVVPYITALGNSLAGGVPAGGTTAQQLKTMIENYLASAQVNLWGHYAVTIIESPTFAYMYAQIDSSQDLILLLGFWQFDPANGGWCRFGGHWVTIAGADNTANANMISFCDPTFDNAEIPGQAGVVWNGWLVPHLPHNVATHNDAGNVSHDWYPVQASGSPGGGISPGNYGEEFTTTDWMNFEGLNVPSRLSQYEQPFNPALPVHTEMEDLLMVCPNFDYGDLGMDYPTIDVESCGPAHPLTDKAWLGPTITSEVQPRIYNQDVGDDGVQFVGLPWTPGSQVSVIVNVTTGLHFAAETLYVNAWKDGNLDGDFDDGPNVPPEVHSMNCSEWVIQDAIAIPGPNTYTFCDPGVTDMGAYDLRMRFRLTSQPVGRFGYGGYWGGGVSNGLGTYDIDWVLGEVEDYDSTDMQLAVNLESFTATAGDCDVALAWMTASETRNDHFEILRDGALLHSMPTLGNDAGGHSYSYTDRTVQPNSAYSYSLVSVDVNNTREVLATRNVLTREAGAIALEYGLAQNYPNPFNASTEIRYTVREAGHVKIVVYNALGEFVTTLVDADQTANEHIVHFDAASLASGVYFYSLEVNGYVAMKKMVLIR